MVEPGTSNQQISELDDGQRDWLDQLLATAAEQGIDTDVDRLAAFFEEYRSEWFAMPEAERPDPNPLITVCGAAMGRLLADELRLRWVVLHDDLGTDLALVDIDPQPMQATFFPLELVGRRWTDDEPDDLAPIFHTLAGQVREMRANPHQP